VNGIYCNYLFCVENFNNKNFQFKFNEQGKFMQAIVIWCSANVGTYIHSNRRNEEVTPCSCVIVYNMYKLIGSST